MTDGISVIRFRLDLLIRLVDTTTGTAVEERNVRFLRDGENVFPIGRGNGNYVFLNCGRRDFELEVRVQGYDTCRLRIRYEILNAQMPVQEVFLIPSENTQKGQPVITFSGTLPGIESIQAVNLNATCCCISGFDERKRIMKLFRMHRSGMDGIYYGLLHLEKQTYEPFAILKEVSGDSVKIDHLLTEPFSVNAPISRIVFGSVTPEGRYCMRVRDDRERLMYLVRYVVDGKERFQMADFRALKDGLK